MKTHNSLRQPPAVTTDANAQDAPSNRQSFEATVESVRVRTAADGSAVTVATLRSESKTLYAAWKNSYFARDIAVHRKYQFTGALKSSRRMQYLADPIFTDLPVVSKYFDFSLLKPGEHQPHSGMYITSLVLLLIAIPAVTLTVIFNSAFMEEQLVRRPDQVSITTSK